MMPFDGLVGEVVAWMVKMRGGQFGQVGGAYSMLTEHLAGRRRRRGAAHRALRRFPAFGVDADLTLGDDGAAKLQI